jgi:hypothetical protein
MEHREEWGPILAILASYTRVILCRQNTCVLGGFNHIQGAVKADNRHEI